MLKNFMTQDALAGVFLKQQFPFRFPPAANRTAWSREGSRFREVSFPLYLKKAEEILGKDYAEIYPILKAGEFFSYVRTGNRRIFETSYFTRRSHLALFCLAEAMEYRRRFLPAVVEGIWQLLSEPVWYLPAHGYYRENDPMPRFDLPRTDLFCAETGATLACVVRLLKKELTAESAELLTWVREFCIERVIVPVEEERVHEWWLDGLNNWGPWCASNVALTAFTFLRDQPERLARLILKLAECCDSFYNRYAADGGCDEGPGYFMVAGIRLMLFLDLLNTYTGGSCNWFYTQEKFRNIGDYIAKVHLTGPWFACMADSAAKFDRLNAGLLNHYAELSGSARLKSFAAEAAFGFQPRETGGIPDRFSEKGTFLHLVLLDELAQIFWAPDPAARGSFPGEGRTVLPDLQFYLFRQNPEKEESGSILCIKGGHNNENHNHNDVGEFELFFDGKPVIIDCGATDYTKFTFSERRYENRFLNSSGHNVPAFNGVLQAPGAEFAAGHRELLADGVAIDIAGAYPKECGVTSCVRRAVLTAEGVVSIEDTVSGKGTISVELPLYCAVKPELTPAGIEISGMRLKLRGIELERLEEIPLEDVRMKLSWGDRLWCIHLQTTIETSGTCRLEFQPVS